MDDLRLAFQRLLGAIIADHSVTEKETEIASAVIGIAQIAVKDLRRLADAMEKQANTEERIEARMAELHERMMSRPLTEPVVLSPQEPAK